MNISNELSGLQANLEYAVRMVNNLSRDNAGRPASPQGGGASELCMHLDMIKDYLSSAQKRIDDIEGTMRHTYRDDVESVLNSLDM
jgi:hypothetical protein